MESKTVRKAIESRIQDAIEDYYDTQGESELNAAYNLMSHFYLLCADLDLHDLTARCLDFIQSVDESDLIDMPAGEIRH